jgi:hypothetical protein
MEREEPHFGKPDLSDVEFRPRRYRGPSTQPPDQSYIWKIGASVGVSVLIALLIFNAYERHQDRKDAELALKVLADDLRKSALEDEKFLREHPPVQTIRINTPTPTYRAPLKTGERCIQGRRFKRVENGWIQLPSQPC